jgi:hypothetical protein
MSEENKGQNGEGSNPASPTPEEAIAKLSEQIENLNKGIGVYRNEAQAALEAARVANEKLAEYEKKGKDKKDDDVELTPEQQKQFDDWAKKNGIVTKEELDAEKYKIAQDSVKNIANTAVDDFLEKHPEYDDDEKWAEVQEQFNLYKTPSDLAGYKKLLEKIHKELSGEDESTAKAKVRAEIAKNDRLKLGGKGGSKGGDTFESRVDSLQEKYPNLSRSQIEARIAEIDSLYKKD